MLAEVAAIYFTVNVGAATMIARKRSQLQRLTWKD